MEEKIFYAKSQLPNGLQPSVKYHVQAVAKLAEKYGSEIGLGRELPYGRMRQFRCYSYRSEK